MIGGNTMQFHKKKAGEIRLEGRADSNGVAFAARVHDGDKVNRYQGHIAYMEDGKLVDKTFYGDINHAGIDYKISRMLTRFHKFMFWIVLVLLGINIVFAFFPGILKEVLYWTTVVVCSVMLFGEAVVINYARLKKDWEVTQFLKYLAAMNSTRNAYYKLGRVPSLKEARRYSAFSSESKYLNNTYLFTFICYIVLLNVIPDWKLMILFAGLAILFRYIEKKHKIYFWQWFIYSRPDNVHYCSALTAMTESIEKTKVMVIDAEE